MGIRILFIVVNISFLILSNAFAQNPIEHNEETINYIDESGIKQGVWKIYSPDDDQAPKGNVHVECNFINGELVGHISIKKEKKTLIEIRPEPKKNKANFKANIGSKEISGYLLKGKKTSFFDSDGNRFSEKEQDWLRKHTEFFPMHYGGSYGMQKIIKQIFEPENIKDEKGRIIISYLVDSNGYIINPKVVKIHKDTSDADNLLEKEALRIIKLLPRMQPAFQGDRFVKLNFTMPLNF